MEGLKTGVDAWSKFKVLTLVYNFSFLFLMLDAAHTPSCWFTFLFCGRYSSWKVVFCYPLGGVVTIMVT